MYPLPGPLPAGPYTISVNGYQAKKDAQLHFDVKYRRAGEPDHLIVSGESMLAASDDGGVPKGLYGAVLDGPAAPARCDDLLVVTVTLVSGSEFLEFFSNVSLP